MTTDDDFAIVAYDAVSQEEFPESGIGHRKLTEALGCTEMRINTMTLEPGQVTAPHAHERQEEVYVALDGGHVQLGETIEEVPRGGIVRIGPDPVRSIRNETDDETQTWLLFGAPPLGTVDDFGEYTMPDG